MFLSPLDRSKLAAFRKRVEAYQEPVTLQANLFLSLMALQDDLVQQRDRAIANQERWFEAAEEQRDRVAEATALLQRWAINAGHLDICALQNGSHCTCGLTETVRWLKEA